MTRAEVEAAARAYERLGTSLEAGRIAADALAADLRAHRFSLRHQKQLTRALDAIGDRATVARSKHVHLGGEWPR